MNLTTNNPEDTILMAYVPIHLDEIEDFLEVMNEIGWRIEVITTKEFFDQQKFKTNSPRA